MGKSEKRSKAIVLAPIKINLLRMHHDIRVRFVLFVTAMLIIHYLKPYIAYAAAADTDCTLCMLPLLFQRATISVGAPKTMLHIGLLLLLCDAPFSNSMTPYILLRSGRSCWWKSGCLTVIIISFCYMLFITLISSLVMLPAANWNDSWGQVFTDFKQKSELTQAFPHIQISYDVVKYLYPSGTQIYVFIAGWCSFTLLGLIMYLVSMLFDNAAYGFAAAGFVIMIDPVINWVEYPYRYWLDAFSPVGWCSPDQFRFMNIRYFLSVPFVAVSFTILIILFVFLIRSASLRSEIMKARETEV